MPRPAENRIDRQPSAVPHAGDLAVAGAIPATFVAAPALAEGGIAVSPSASATVKGATGGSGATDKVNDLAAPGTAIGSGGLVAPPLVTASGLATITVPAPAVSPETAPLAQAHGAMIAPFVPIPQGAGAPSPDPVAMGQAVSAPLPDGPAMGQVASATIAAPLPPTAPMDAAMLDAMRTQVAALQESLDALSERLPTVAASAQTQVTETLTDVAAGATVVDATVGGVIDHVDQTIASATATVSEVTDNIVGQVDQTLATTATDTLTAPILAQVATTAETVARTVDTLDAIVQPITQDVVATAKTVSATDELITTVARPVTSLLDDGITGDDPPAGITTLVGMVSAADAFGLNDSGVAEPLAPALGALGSVDLLADIAPVDALLGMKDHPDAHGLANLDGLFGHG